MATRIRTYNFRRAAPGMALVTIKVVRGNRAEESTYSVLPVQQTSHPGVTAHYNKQDGNRLCYLTTVDPDNNYRSCTCDAGLEGVHCRHAANLLHLITSGRLASL